MGHGSQPQEAFPNESNLLNLMTLQRGFEVRGDAHWKKRINTEVGFTILICHFYVESHHGVFFIETFRPWMLPWKGTAVFYAWT